MALDFKNLLQSLAQGDDDAVAGTVLARRKNGPPTIDLTPAQSAVQDVASGVLDPQPTVQGPAIQQGAMPQGAVQDQSANDNVTQGGLFSAANMQGPTPDRPPSMEGLPLDESEKYAQQDYTDAVNAPIVKQSLWKDIGAKIIGASNAFVKGYRGDDNIEPAYGWGQIKHNNVVNRAAQKLAPLQQQQGVNRQAAAQTANTELAKARPGILQQQADTAQFRATQKAQNDTEMTNFRKSSDAWKHDDRDKWLDLQGKKNEARANHDSTMEDIYQQRQDELERHNGVTEGQGDKKIEQGDRKLGQVDAKQSDVADRAKQHMQSLPEKQRTATIDRLVTTWMKSNKKATPDEVTEVRRKLQDTYGK